jgi:hypothetical protein
VMAGRPAASATATSRLAQPCGLSQSGREDLKL